MDRAVLGSLAEETSTQDQTSLSYKFQRLREKLREGIASGELSGKLPGERALAKRFHVNAKTLSKALTDLAAEGLLDRSIGRGTFVKGSAPQASQDRRWLLVCDESQMQSEVVRLLRTTQPDIEIVNTVAALRPSFLNQFGAVIDLSPNTPETFIRDLVIRNITVVSVCKQPGTFSTHAVVYDELLGLTRIVRDLLAHGHRKLAAIEPKNCTVVATALRTITARVGPDATIDACLPSEVLAVIENGVTALVCNSVAVALETKAHLDRAGIRIPGQVSIAAIGAALNDPPIDGNYIDHAQKVSAVVQLIKEKQVSRPTTIWLAGQCKKRGTVGPVHGSAFDPSQLSEDGVLNSSAL